MDWKEKYCWGGRLYSNALNLIECKNVNPEINKIKEMKRRNCDNCERN